MYYIGMIVCSRWLEEVELMFEMISWKSPEGTDNVSREFKV
jgi:hypothetical protein